MYSANYNRHSVTFWDVSSGNKINEITFPSEPLSLAYNPKDGHLAVGLEDGSVNIRQAATGDYVKAVPDWIKSWQTGVDKLAYSPNFTYLFGSNNGLPQPYLLNVQNNYENVALGEKDYLLEAGDAQWLDFSFDSTGKYIAVTNANYSDQQGTLAIFDSSTRRMVGTASAGSAPSAVSFSHDNQRILAGRTLFDASVLPSKEMTGIKIKTDSTVMNSNQTQSISASSVFNDGTEENLDPSLLTWKSTNPSAAKILYGKVYSYATGETTLTASYKGFQYSITIQVQDFKEFDQQLNISADKTWEVRFNIPVDVQTIKEKNIFVTDESGNIVPLFYYSEKGNETIIQLIPVNNYNSRETYTLWVKEVKSETGKILKQYTKMKFTIK